MAEGGITRLIQEEVNFYPGQAIGGHIIMTRIGTEEKVIWFNSWFFHFLPMGSLGRFILLWGFFI
jgi:hypothetical protein